MTTLNAGDRYAPGAKAGAHPQVTDGDRKPLGYEQIADVGGSPVSTLTVPAGARVAIIQATGQNVRWRDDGTAPSATVGIQLAAGDSFLYVGKLSALQFIEEAAGGILNVSYYA